TGPTRRTGSAAPSAGATTTRGRSEGGRAKSRDRRGRQAPARQTQHEADAADGRQQPRATAGRQGAPQGPEEDGHHGGGG
ncbi:hypothetical protein C3R44_23900, partial [Mycobacterium tuberculosis]